VGPGRFKDGTTADGIIVYGFSEHRMLGVVWDADGSTTDWESVSCGQGRIGVGYGSSRGINMSQFFRISIRLASVVMLGTNWSISGVRRV